jgi:hypothetical protein
MSRPSPPRARQSLDASSGSRTSSRTSLCAPLGLFGQNEFRIYRHSAVTTPEFHRDLPSFLPADEQPFRSLASSAKRRATSAATRPFSSRAS